MISKNSKQIRLTTITEKLYLFRIIPYHRPGSLSYDPNKILRLLISRLEQLCDYNRKLKNLIY